MNVEVRKGTPADSNALARLRWEHELEEGKAVGDKAKFVAAFVNWAAIELGGPDWKVWIAEIGDESVGNLYLQTIHKVPRTQSVGRAWGYLTAFFVVAGARGQGVGGKLLKAAGEWARVEELEFVYVWPSSQSIPLFKRCGFTGDQEAMQLTLPT